MSLVYDFSFSPDYAGLAATVTDLAGSEVAGSPVTLDETGKGSLSLDEGNYKAETSNTALAKGHAVTNGVLNLPASVTAGGGAPIGRYQFECNDGGEAGASIPWDTAYDTDGYTGYAGSLPTDMLLDLPAGRYAASWEVWVAAPAGDRLIRAALLSTGASFPESSVKAGDTFIPAGKTATLYASGTVLIAEEPSRFDLRLTERTGDADPVGSPLAVTYALLYLDWLGTL